MEEPLHESSFDPSDFISGSTYLHVVSLEQINSELLSFLGELLSAHKEHSFLIDFEDRAENLINKAKGL